MAVAFVNTNNVIHVASNSVSQAFTINTGTNLAAFAVIMFDNTASGAISGTPTLGGSNMTAAGSVANNSTSNANAVIYYLTNPTTGAAVTLAVSGNANVNEFYVNVIVFSGVDQVTPVRSGTYQTTNTNSLTISSNVSDLTISAIDGGSSGVGSTNQTSDGVNNAGTYGAGSDHATTAASSVTHTWTGTTNPAMAGFSIQAAGTGITTGEMAAARQCGQIDPIFDHIGIIGT